MPRIEYRPEKAGDETGIRLVHEQAFGRPNEANLVDALRNRGALLLSMVALRGSHIVGHVSFSEVAIGTTASTFGAVGLGPIAVLPSHQRRGIGSQLVRLGLDRCRQAEHQMVVVVGEPRFYSQFAFVAARTRGIRCEFDVPDDAFMVLEIDEKAWTGRNGIAKYQDEFRHLV
ncbi:MAG: GNAT family N-acetyltransferase [Planctomycetota bacterium]|jgi:putative acetyltransferase